MSESDIKTTAQTGDFEPEQKRYLEGFVAGVQIAKAAKSVASAASAATAASGAAPAAAEPTGPDAAALKAQDRTVAAGGKLNDQEKFKRDRTSVRRL